jgi:hypothetical protein
VLTQTDITRLRTQLNAGTRLITIDSMEESRVVETFLADA